MEKLFYLCMVLFTLVSCSKSNDTPVVTPPVTVILPDTIGTGWTKITTLPKGVISDIFFIDNATGYVCGDSGIYKSVNGGNNWAKINDNVFSINIAVANTNRLCLVQGNQVAQISQDGGISFQNFLSGAESFKDCFYSSQNTCFLYGVYSIWKSTNGGVSFSQIYSFGNASDFGSLFFLDDMIGFVCRSQGVYKTTDGGVSWSLVLPISNKQGSVDFVNPTTGFCSSSDLNGLSVIYKTTDAGSTWQPVCQLSFPAYYIDVDFVSSTEGYMSTGRKIYKTTDGGATWNAVVRLGNAGFIEIHFTDANHGWGCTTDGSVLKFTQ